MLKADSTGFWGSRTLGNAFRMNFSITPPLFFTPLKFLFSLPGTHAGGGGRGRGAPESRRVIIHSLMLIMIPTFDVSDAEGPITRLVLLHSADYQHLILLRQHLHILLIATGAEAILN